MLFFLLSHTQPPPPPPVQRIRYANRLQPKRTIFAHICPLHGECSLIRGCRLNFSDNLFLDITWHAVIAIEIHCVDAASAGH